MCIRDSIWGKVAELPDLVADPAAREMGMFATIDHPEAGPFETLNAPFKMSASEVAVRGPAPDVGEHSRDVLASFGLDAERIEALVSSGVVGQKEASA